MHRFYCPNTQEGDAVLVLSERESHHAVAVLRLREGDKSTVLDGSGRVLECRVGSASRKQVEMEVLRTIVHPPRAVSVTLAQALPKGSVFDSIIQKAVELGVSRIVPLLTERVVATVEESTVARKTEKWRQVAIEAMKQSGNPWLPRIEEPLHIPELGSVLAEAELALVASLQPGSLHPRLHFQRFAQARGRLPASAAVCIGPEGDLTSGEVETLLRQGALPITLGPLVLRVDTAATYCLSVVNHELSVPAL